MSRNINHLKRKTYFSLVVFSSLILCNVIFPAKVFGAAIDAGGSGTIILSQDEFILSKNMNNKLILSGVIEKYIQGIPIDLTITKPDNTNDVLTLYATSKGEYNSEMPMSQTTPIGSYKIVVTYLNVNVGIAYFTVTSEKDAVKQENNIPFWIKKIAKWWSMDSISDSDFVNCIEWLVRNQIIPGYVSEKIPNSQTVAKTSLILPNWIKDSAELWSHNKIKDSDFNTIIGYLIINKIIDVPGATVNFSFGNPVLDPSTSLALEIGKIPKQVGGIKLIDQQGVEPFFPGSVAGNWLLFHDGDHLVLRGEGYLLIRWEIEHDVAIGIINPPIIRGDISYLGEEGKESVPEINGWNNKYYQLNGTVYVENTEDHLGAYNLAISSVNKNHLLIQKESSNTWSLGVKERQK